jgi:hypothetical protein
MGQHVYFCALILISSFIPLKSVRTDFGTEVVMADV